MDIVKSAALLLRRAETGRVKNERSVALVTAQGEAHTEPVR